MIGGGANLGGGSGGGFAGRGRRLENANGTLAKTLNLPVGGGGGSLKSHLDLGVETGKTGGGGSGATVTGAGPVVG